MTAPGVAVAAAEAIIRREHARRCVLAVAERRARRIALSRAIARNAAISVVAVAAYVAAIMTILTAYALWWAFSI